ncbi:MAG TPA: glycosyltransferase, partial [Candidatus Polarisedimenticolia bacterium]|nr:glycosyltransferase [Candidatus Polarisedimenticolia bacterium]
MSGAGHSTAVLLLVRDPGRVEADLPALLPGRILRPIRREEVQHLAPMALLRWLRGLGADELVMLSDDLDSHERLWRLQALGALPTAPRRYLVDLRGRRLLLSTLRFLVRDLPYWSRGLAASAVVLARTRARVRRLRRAPRHAPRPATGRRICSLRTELWAGQPAGGSVGHTAGVASGLRASGAELFFVCTDRLPLIDAGLHAMHLVPPDRFYNLCREIHGLAHSLRVEREGAAILARHPADLVYQRFDVANQAGVALSRRLGLPFILEYNGSEVWMNDHWDRRLRWRSLFAGIEEINLRHADLIVVVSEVLRDGLRARGVEADRILVQPNGVDPERFHPALDGSEVLRRHALSGGPVVGFIGTFGPWHGAPVLARAAVRVLRERPEARFLFVGDGSERAAAESILAGARASGAAIFTGLVPQAEGPAHLATMDVLVAPHVPNLDGTRFFGSPTKLFEYMAMGRGIVASRLEQIG